MKFWIRVFTECFLENETKLDDENPDSFDTNKHYNIIRRDSGSNRGRGVIVFIRKEYQIIKLVKHDSLELILTQLKIKDNLINLNYSFFHSILIFNYLLSVIEISFFFKQNIINYST